MKPLTLAAIGCGSRSRTYLSLAARSPERFRIVAAADPDSFRVERIRALTGNPEFRGFASDEEILAEPQLADVMIIGTQDALHEAHCMGALGRGYDVLLEKPIANSLDAVLRLEHRARELGRRVMICHVLRYTPFYQKVKNIVDEGLLGDIVSLRASEGVEAFHQAHSFVRGHWAVTGASSPMIIAKCCHDLDIIAWLMSRPCLTVSSFGDRSHFHSGNMPDEAPLYCLEGCPVEQDCIYYAGRYLTERRHWLNNVFNGGANADSESIRNWLTSSPWGRCVYRCDNTAVDHQVVNMEFAGGSTAVLTMTAFDEGRNIEIYGTRGVLRGGHRTLMDSGYDIIVESHGNRGTWSYRTPTKAGGYEGHGGGDPGLMEALYDEMTTDDSSAMSSSIQNSVTSHIIGFAAEEARLTHKTVDIARFVESENQSAT